MQRGALGLADFRLLTLRLHSARSQPWDDI